MPPAGAKAGSPKITREGYQRSRLKTNRSIVSDFGSSTIDIYILYYIVSIDPSNRIEQSPRLLIYDRPVTDIYSLTILVFEYINAFS